MGYYTSHELKVLSGNSDLITQFREENDSAKYALDSQGGTSESCKWYDSDTDLMEFSKKHPAELFELSGEGEESGDLWKLYVKNGKSKKVKAVITYPEFNESDLN